MKKLMSDGRGLWATMEILLATSTALQLKQQQRERFAEHSGGSEGHSVLTTTVKYYRTGLSGSLVTPDHVDRDGNDLYFEASAGHYRPATLSRWESIIFIDIFLMKNFATASICRAGSKSFVWALSHL